MEKEMIAYPQSEFGVPRDGGVGGTTLMGREVIAHPQNKFEGATGWTLKG